MLYNLDTHPHHDIYMLTPIPSFHASLMLAKHSFSQMFLLLLRYLPYCQTTPSFDTSLTCTQPWHCWCSSSHHRWCPTLLLALPPPSPGILQSVQHCSPVVSPVSWCHWNCHLGGRVFKWQWNFYCVRWPYYKLLLCNILALSLIHCCGMPKRLTILFSHSWHQST